MSHFMSAYIYGLIALVGLFSAIGPVGAQDTPTLPDQQQSIPLTPQDIIPERSEPETEDGTPSIVTGQQKRDAELTRLLNALKRSHDTEIVQDLTRQIQYYWSRSGSESIDLLMQWAENAISEGNYIIAMDFLDNVVALKSDYAEGWQRRALVHLQMNDLSLAMQELHRVLQLEPRHYEAYLWLGNILEITGHEDEALRAYEKLLEIYPLHEQAQRRLANLLESRTAQAL